MVLSMSDKFNTTLNVGPVEQEKTKLGCPIEWVSLPPLPFASALSLFNDLFVGMPQLECAYPTAMPTQGLWCTYIVSSNGRIPCSLAILIQTS